MGADFLQKNGKFINVSWDRRRLQLATPDLFTRPIECPSRVEPARVRDGVILQKGDDVTVEISGQGLFARRGMTTVAEFASPPCELVDAIAALGGIVSGSIEEVYNTPRVVEIEICI